MRTEFKQFYPSSSSQQDLDHLDPLLEIYFYLIVLKYKHPLIYNKVIVGDFIREEAAHAVSPASGMSGALKLSAEYYHFSEVIGEFLHMEEIPCKGLDQL